MKVLLLLAPLLTLTLAQTNSTECIGKCTAGDVNCLAKCTNVPNPTPQMINATTTCVAACPSANTDAWAKCRDDCINKFFLTAPANTTGGTNGDKKSNAASTASTASMAVVVALIAAAFY
jgi:hypothetical protein